MADKSKHLDDRFHFDKTWVPGQVVPKTCSIVRHKRAPQRQLPKQKNDIYVNKRSDFKCQLERAQKLLDSGYTEIYIHGLGAAINRAINLALQLQQKGHGSIELSAQTSSVQLVDDFEPLEDEQEGYTHLRTNSSIKIKVYRVNSDELTVTATKR